MVNLINSIILFAQQTAPAGAEGGKAGSGWSSILFLVLLIVVFYLFFIRPSVKKQKEQKKFQESIGKGDSIVTIGGIHGKIIEVKDKTFVIESEGSRMEIEKTAVNAEFAAENKK
ncbi:MAG: preprotein translocase subunit YajC [Bacteroidales bacterium]|jgi:preprotein translocase subunit YajC|nr:preprotein translocase subunit YajC [Bacteroidales bacterium]MDD2204930.1 preprotein translocase subunit YajC [Bacteroidales bacterium]MDD3152654.1 preprotein translocase subunit YajC [Bacteroidales bacterium]MDD3914553.1 preprotein translocase subunit YajC [Bacteroidales bacterium]MDD4634447.1 preprotein translocase subunit YajC [Bacteroidales bacterium]